MSLNLFLGANDGSDVSDTDVKGSASHGCGVGPMMTLNPNSNDSGSDLRDRSRSPNDGGGGGSGSPERSLASRKRKSKSQKRREKRQQIQQIHESRSEELSQNNNHFDSDNDKDDKNQSEEAELEVEGAEDETEALFRKRSSPGPSSTSTPQPQVLISTEEPKQVQQKSILKRSLNSQTTGEASSELRQRAVNQMKEQKKLGDIILEPLSDEEEWDGWWFCLKVSFILLVLFSGVFTALFIYNWIGPAENTHQSPVDSITVPPSPELAVVMPNSMESKESEPHPADRLLEEELAITSQPLQVTESVELAQSSWFWSWFWWGDSTTEPSLGMEPHEHILSTSEHLEKEAEQVTESGPSQGYWSWFTGGNGDGGDGVHEERVNINEAPESPVENHFGGNEPPFESNSPPPLSPSSPAGGVGGDPIGGISEEPVSQTASRMIPTGGPIHWSEEEERKLEEARRLAEELTAEVERHRVAFETFQQSSADGRTTEEQRRQEAEEHRKVAFFECLNENGANAKAAQECENKLNAQEQYKQGETSQESPEVSSKTSQMGDTNREVIHEDADRLMFDTSFAFWPVNDVHNHVNRHENEDHDGGPEGGAGRGDPAFGYHYEGYL